MPKKLKVIGFDLDKQKVFALQKSPDDQQLTTDDRNGNLIFTTNPEKIKEGDFGIVNLAYLASHRSTLTSKE
ncbi:hypothetical protein DK28_0203540 [Peptococcaceae bacterium SCADC1_2_3]|nr:hypothetical protein DK28_0203540 [Peptococcaceae bacterium SCADC1_2_3]KFI35861.1 hypothetical protein HY00_00955 [Peptococcaceae bacterium SCADC1_2_3]